MTTPYSKTERWCDVCGYDLAGLPERGVCPECNAMFSGTGGWSPGPPKPLVIEIVRLGWPTPIGAAAVICMVFGPVFVSVVLFLACGVALLFNTPAAIERLMVARYPPGVRQKRFIPLIRLLEVSRYAARVLLAILICLLAVSVAIALLALLQPQFHR